MKQGSAWVCPRNSKREPKNGKRVIFADAKAYAQPLEECAASRCKTPHDSLFQSCHPLCQTHSVNNESDFVSPFQAWTSACKLRGEVLLDTGDEIESNEETQHDTVWNGAQTHVSDLWCVDHCFPPLSQRPNFDLCEGLGGFEWQDQFLHADEDQYPQNHTEATLESDAASSSGHIGQGDHQTTKQSPTPTDRQQGWNERPLAFSLAGADDIDLLLHRMLDGDATLTIHSFGTKIETLANGLSLLMQKDCMNGAGF